MLLVTPGPNEFVLTVAICTDDDVPLRTFRQTSTCPSSRTRARAIAQTVACAIQFKHAL